MSWLTPPVLVSLGLGALLSVSGLAHTSVVVFLFLAPSLFSPPSVSPSVVFLWGLAMRSPLSGSSVGCGFSHSIGTKA